MTDIFAKRDRLVAAALALAVEKPWSDVTLFEIGERAGLSLDEVRRAAGAKSQIIAHFMRQIDDQVLKGATRRSEGETKRDKLFEIVMSRFDAMAPHKEALRSIRRAGAADTTLVMPFLNAQRWMLAAAGIETDGPGGLVRTLGLGSLYASVFETWLDDDDPGMARTMAALDRRLRRAESTIRSVDGVADGFGRIANDVGAVGRAIVNGFLGARRDRGGPRPDDHPPA